MCFLFLTRNTFSLYLRMTKKCEITSKVTKNTYTVRTFIYLHVHNDAQLQKCQFGKKKHTFINTDTGSTYFYK